LEAHVADETGEMELHLVLRYSVGFKKKLPIVEFFIFLGNLLFLAEMEYRTPRKWSLVNLLQMSNENNFQPSTPRRSSEIDFWISRGISQDHGRVVCRKSAHIQETIPDAFRTNIN